jgi:hypothetical protein
MQFTLGGAMAAPVTALRSPVAEPQESGAQAISGRGIRLGFDSWTLNGYGWTAIQYLDYAGSQWLDTVQGNQVLSCQETAMPFPGESGGFACPFHGGTGRRNRLPRHT